MPLNPMIQKTQLYMLVDRLSKKVYYDNLSYKEGSRLLLEANFPNKMLIVKEYKFATHSTMGDIWMPLSTS